MAKASLTSIPASKTYTLELDQEEADQLMVVMYGRGGRLTGHDSVYSVLADAGAEPVDAFGPRRVTEVAAIRGLRS